MWQDDAAGLGVLVPQQIAFMVMPFGVRPTDAVERGGPAEVDFDALWHRVLEPVLADAGYVPVRADADTGAVIIAEMIQRLAVADLVVAEISTANANVYYEVGVRHAARTTGCVLVAADWAEPVFDLRSVRRVTYPLGDGTIGDLAAEVARDSLRAGLAAMAHGTSPVFEAVPGFPDTDPDRLTAFKDLVDDLSHFQGAVRAIRTAPRDEQESRTLTLVETYGDRPAVRDAVVLELLRLLRDHVDFAAVLSYIDGLPDHLRSHPLVSEQRYLAMAKEGDHVEASGHLQQLIEDLGPTSERYGLLGGRFKQLSRDDERSDRERARYLNRAIDAYHRGMLCDLNDYYPSSNLPRLYRERGREGDDELAEQAAAVALVACERAIASGTDDEWTRPTLLQAAVQAGDVERIRDLVGQIEDEGLAVWKLETTADDLRQDIALQPDPDGRALLEDELWPLLEQASPTG